jgi:hypothetical protein
MSGVVHISDLTPSPISGPRFADSGHGLSADGLTDKNLDRSHVRLSQRLTRRQTSYGMPRSSQSKADVRKKDPTGKSLGQYAAASVQPFSKNILIFRIRKSVHISIVSCPQEGRFAVVTNVGCGMRWTWRCL